MSNISTELFSITYRDKYIIYAPLRRLAFLVTPEVVNLLHEINSNKQSVNLTEAEEKNIKPFIDLGLINGKSDKIPSRADEPFLPTYVTLFLTTRCNLRCIYCYASGGEKDDSILPLEIARSAIDFIIRNALTKKQKGFGVGFHGGGEPPLAWRTLTGSVEYAKKRAKEAGMKINFSIATNGVMAKEKLDYIMGNFTGLSLSFDGTEDIQNRQRPLRGGKGSFNGVMGTIKRLNEKKFPYSIRSTITDGSVRYMDKIVEFIGNNCKIKRIHFEPVFACGRCFHTGVGSPSAEEFIEGFRNAQEVAERIGIPIIYSGARVDTITTSFCKASGNSFCVTPLGNVTSCYEVCSKDDPRSEIFFYGKWDSSKKQFILFKEKLTYLRKRTVNNIPYCEDCFCKYHCAGDCLAKASKGKDLMCITNSARCQINQTLTLDQIVKILKRGERNLY